MMGEKSMPIPDIGTSLRTRYKTGSVMLYKKCTMGLLGSGFTQESKARMMMIHIYNIRTMFSTVAVAEKK